MVKPVLRKTLERRSNRRLPIWRVATSGSLDYTWDGRRMRFTLGVGARVDGISANWLVRAIIYLICGNAARVSAAFHDMACQSRELSKDHADWIFLQAMTEAGVPKWLRRRMYNSVRSSTVRNNWPQPELDALYTIGGLPGQFRECPVVLL